MLAFVTAFTIAACGNGDNGDENGEDDLAHLEEARDRLVLSADLDNVTSDISLPMQLGNYPDVEISWSSSEPDIVADDGTVTRPEPGEGNARVTLTATLTYNEEEVTRDYSLTVIEAVERNLITDFASMYDRDSEDAPAIDDIVTVQGVVTSRWSGGVFLYDGTTHFGIYDAWNFDIQDFVEVGDELEYTGHFARYNTLFQLTERDSFEVLDTNVDYDMPVHDSTIEAMHEYDAGGEDMDVHGQHFKVEGLLTTKGEYDNLYLESMDSDQGIMFYHYSFEDSLDALEQYLGDVIEVEVVYYTDHSRDGILVVFQGGADDIETVEVDEEALMNVDINALEDVTTYGDDVTLPTTGNNGTEFENWTSSDDTVIADDGSFVDFPAEITTVTFTGDASFGDESGEATFEVTVLPEEGDTVADARAAEEGDHVFFEGVVTSFPVFGGSSGFFVQDEDGTAIMITDDYDVTVGDKILIGGEIELYESNQDGHALHRVTNTLLVENHEGDHDIFVFDDVTAEDIANDFPNNQSQRYYLENVTVDEVSEQFNTVYIDTGEEYRIRYDIRNYGPELENTYFEAGDTIEWIEFTVRDISHGDIRVEYVTGKDFVELDESITVD